MVDESPRGIDVEYTQAVAKDVDSTVRSGRGSIFGHAADLANAFTLAGLFCGVLGIYFAVRGVFSAAVIALLWATFFDWCDGPIARRTKGRPHELRALGGQLDSLVDIVSSGVGPAILLLSIGGFSPWFIPGASANLREHRDRGRADDSHGLPSASPDRGLPPFTGPVARGESPDP